MKSWIGFSFFILFLAPTVGLPFPDTFRHGYVNCSTCHVSPAGGGIMNGYGRSLSRELISRWSRANEEQPLHGLAPIPEGLVEKLFFGGDARFISLKGEKVDGTKVDEGFWMQAQLRAGFAWEQFKVLASFGKLENPRENSNVRWVSPEFFLLWTPIENVHFRIGRFEPIYGLRLPDHNLLIRSELGLQPWIERDTAEMILETEKQFLSLAGTQSLSTVSPTQQSTGFFLNFAQVLGETLRVGASTRLSEGQNSRRRATTLHAFKAWTPEIYTMTELTRSSNNGADRELAFARVGWEVSKGIVPLIQSQFRWNVNTTKSELRRTGVGLQFYPRPHFEIIGLAEQIQAPEGSSQESYLLIHYYL